MWPRGVDNLATAMDRAAPDGRVLETEICVVGAGPAGATVARRLALLGHRVCLVERAAFPRHRIGESLPPSILPVLETLALRERVVSAGFLRPGGAIVHWAGVQGRPAYPEDSPGFQVDRGRFDALLLEAAREAGVKILQPVHACRPTHGPECWTVPLRGSAAHDAVRARYLIDAAGKHAALGRRTTPSTARTAALYAYWRAPAGIGPETRVEAGDETWYWGAPLPDGSFNAAVFLDMTACAGLSDGRRHAAYRALLQRSVLLKACAEGQLLGPVRCCDASGYHDPDPIGITALRVGEAGFSIDPLSSQGVQSAMASAIQASIAVHTILTRAEHARLAIDFFRDRQRESVAMHARLSAGHYARQCELRPNAFWRARSRMPPELGTPRFPPTAPPLRGAQPIELSRAATVVETPVISGEIVVPGSALAHPNLERPVMYLDGLQIAPLIRRISPGIAADRVIEQWSAYAGRDRCQRILQWLWRHRVVIPSSCH